MKKTYVKPECKVYQLIIRPQVICSSVGIQENTNNPLSEYDGELG